MKIKYLELKDHPILGDLKLELFDDERVYDTIVFAGENGVGKTSILKEITSLARDVGDRNYLQKIIFELDRDEWASLGIGVTEGVLSLTKNEQSSSLLNIYNVSFGDGIIQRFSNNNYSDHPVDKLLHKVIVKIRRNDAEPVLSKVQSVSNTDIDEEVDSRNSSRLKDLNTDINIMQLLVDLSTKDAVEFTNYYKENNMVNDALKDKRISRFRESFNGFFDNDLVFEGVSESLDVNFKKNNNIFDAIGLSSGEKTIVQCGAAILKNANSNEIPITLIDEPEQALHPKWQEHILSYYRNILSVNPNKHNQLFVTTHSEHVLKEALQNDDIMVIILRKKEDGKTRYDKITKKICTLPYISYDEIKYKVFGIVSNDYHDDLLGFIQEKSGLGCKKQDEVFASDTGCEKIHWNGYNARGEKKENLDCETLPFFVRNFFHHPELRQYNDRLEVDDEVLKKSIEYLELKVKEILQNETV